MKEHNKTHIGQLQPCALQDAVIDISILDPHVSWLVPAPMMTCICTHHKWQLWGSNPRPCGLAPEASALDHSAKLSYWSHQKVIIHTFAYFFGPRSFHHWEESIACSLRLQIVSLLVPELLVHNTLHVPYWLFYVVVQKIALFIEMPQWIILVGLLVILNDKSSSCFVAFLSSTGTFITFTIIYKHTLTVHNFTARSGTLSKNLRILKDSSSEALFLIRFMLGYPFEFWFGEKSSGWASCSCPKLKYCTPFRLAPLQTFRGTFEFLDVCNVLDVWEVSDFSDVVDVWDVGNSLKLIDPSLRCIRDVKKKTCMHEQPRIGWGWKDGDEISAFIASRRTPSNRKHCTPFRGGCAPHSPASPASPFLSLPFPFFPCPSIGRMW